MRAGRERLSWPGLCRVRGDHGRRVPGGGWVGRPAVRVWFLVLGSAGSPCGFTRATSVPWFGCPLATCEREAHRAGHSWAVHSMIRRAAGCAVSVFVSPLAHRPICPESFVIMGGAAVIMGGAAVDHGLALV
jgi:hypothetical protein